jgi:pfkB family carbohydrate kinase
VIALVGESVLDRVHWPTGEVDERLGGAPIFAARALANTWSAVVVTHGGSQSLRRPLMEFGLPVVEGPPSGTTVFEVSLFGDGRWAESVRAFGEPFSPGDVSGWMAPALSRCTTVVCGAQWRGDFSAETLAVLAAGGRRIYLDGQGMMRPRRPGPIRIQAPRLTSALDGISVLKLGEDEANALIGGPDPDRARALGVPVVVVTLGERGAVVLADGIAIEVDVDPVEGLGDTVGAGDSFLALMAAASEEGADSVAATALACNGVARLLRERLSVERTAAVASR